MLFSKPIIKNYDRIISLGDSCFCTMQLKHYNLRPKGLKHPLDWITGGDFETRINLICNNFDDFLRFERMKLVIEVPNYDNDSKEFDKYIDTKTNLVFSHDFPKNLSFMSAIPNVIGNYSSKIQTLKKDLSDKKKILFVYITDEKIPNKKLKKLLSKLHEKFGYNNIDFMIVQEGNKKREHITKYSVSKNIIKYKITCKVIALNAKYILDNKRYLMDYVFKNIKLKQEIL